jgi:thymidylate synthase (FAD)
VGSLVTPKTFFIGFTEINDEGLRSYLEASGNLDFWKDIEEARLSGLKSAEILCSFYAKLCYKSLTEGKNRNITRTRSIKDNLKGTFSSGHGSCFEHVLMNFVTMDCSRIMTHELVRHRVGTAFSQNSGRYIREEKLDIVMDPILDPVKDDLLEVLSFLETKYAVMENKLGINDLKDFHKKKMLTSALRRMLLEGRSNEIGYSINLRSLRHIIMLRTARYAEWEIRFVFNQIYKIMKEKYPLMFFDAKEREIDGLTEVYGMKMTPYERSETEVMQELGIEPEEYSEFLKWKTSSKG